MERPLLRQDFQPIQGIPAYHSYCNESSLSSKRLHLVLSCQAMDGLHHTSKYALMGGFNLGVYSNKFKEHRQVDCTYKRSLAT